MLKTQEDRKEWSVGSQGKAVILETGRNQEVQVFSGSLATSKVGSFVSSQEKRALGAGDAADCGQGPTDNGTHGAPADWTVNREKVVKITLGLFCHNHANERVCLFF